MNLLAITCHQTLVERLRAAFEGEGHRIIVVPDPIQALAQEAWNEAHAIVVDARGEPLDGPRFAWLMRRELRPFFQVLPIFLIDEASAGPAALSLSDCDGIIHPEASIQELRSCLGPALDEGADPTPPRDLLCVGLPKPLLQKVQGTLEHFGFRIRASSYKEALAQAPSLTTTLCLMGLGSDVGMTLKTLEALKPSHSYVLIAGELPKPSVLRKLFLAGAKEWLDLPLAAPRLFHACRHGLAWLQAHCLQAEYQDQVDDLRERRLQLEAETAALRDEVLTDPLTGFLNRRAFDQHLENAVNQWQRHQRPFVLILGDLDYFKLINDRFGHLIGDTVLRHVADRMRKAIRKSDLAFRIGGEEFAILLNETTLQAGTDVADKLRRKIDEAPILLETGQSVFPTMSFGVGAPRTHDAKALFVAADQALYAAKHKGRNRIEVAAEDVAVAPVKSQGL